MKTIKLLSVFCLLIVAGCANLSDLGDLISKIELPESPDQPQEPQVETPPDSPPPVDIPDEKPTSYSTGGGTYDPTDRSWLLPYQHPAEKRQLQFDDLAGVYIHYGMRVVGPITDWTTSEALGWRIKIFLPLLEGPCDLVYEVEGPYRPVIKEIKDPNVRHD